MINKQHFPIFRIEKARQDLLMAKHMCNDGLEASSEMLTELFTERLTALPYEMDEMEQSITSLLAHITFCLDALEEVNNGLNNINHYFN
jgi:hypothetical protein